MGEHLTDVPVDANAVVAELTNRLAALTLENVKLTVLYTQLVKQRAQENAT